MTSRLLPLVSSLAAVALAVIAGGVFLQLTGYDAIAAYRTLLERGLGDADALTESVKKLAPLLIVGSGLLVAVRAGIWNIGIDGQFLAGALAAGVVGARLAGDVPAPVMWAAAVGAAIVAGLLWALPPAWLKARYGLNEIITTLMMTFVALNLTAWLVKGPLRDPERVAPETAKIPLEERLAWIPGSEVHVGLLAGLLLAIAAMVLFRSTVPGFMLDVLGRNRRAALHAGLPVSGLTVAALLVSGATAGLAGANDVLGVQGVFKANWNPAYGFTAFALVFLARQRPLGLIPFGLFFSALLIGGEAMSRREGVPTYFVELLEGLMLLFFALAVAVERRWERSRQTPGEEATP